MYNHRVPRSGVLVSSCFSSRWKAKDLAADHLVGNAGREFGHLLTDHAHLLAIALTRDNPFYFLAYRRADPSRRRRLPERRPNRLRMAQPTGAYNVESGRRGLIEADMERLCHQRRV